ncbi:peptide chain release factor N(5)-glutamine methyltransferase [Jannaschia pohangensis]|uniref:Release factor glutamine methyltransferase n=1 Tax=Jannaschia pohangensis TaxID=390807 RepID=A0A1I3S8J7_9RHOB|nr:peptide chain release factor N(5)-glutamine methyltransferase [Jannaschia pohangensis]SFJ54312.1 [protein release factor]-glutamine N5-methyltransferase [Jannaschia pohangensis]
MSARDVARAIADARRRLEVAGIPDPARDASALWVAIGEPAVGGGETMTPEVAARYDAAVARRIRHQPVAQIIGRRAFWMHDFRVTPDVLDPRPDTETLVQAALDARAHRLRDPDRWQDAPSHDWPPIPFERVLDLGTGSGCILLSILHECPTATGVGTDISPAALAVAAENAERLGVADRVTLTQSDWFSAVEGSFDMIVSNPPYISAEEMAGLSPDVRDWEPHLALTPGGDGLDAYRAILSRAAEHLTPGGHLLVEIGAGQAAAVTALFEAAQFTSIRVIADINGKDRVVAAEKRAN